MARDPDTIYEIKLYRVGSMIIEGNLPIEGEENPTPVFRSEHHYTSPLKAEEDITMARAAGFEVVGLKDPTTGAITPHMRFPVAFEIPAKNVQEAIIGWQKAYNEAVTVDSTEKREQAGMIQIAKESEVPDLHGAPKDMKRSGGGIFLP